MRGNDISKNTLMGLGSQGENGGMAEFVPLHFLKIAGIIRISQSSIIPGRILSLSAEYVKK
jgi:hypothetical protein